MEFDVAMLDLLSAAENGLAKCTVTCNTSVTCEETCALTCGRTNG